MTKEEMLEEAEYFIKTDPVAKEGFEEACSPSQVFSTFLPECFDLLYQALIRSAVLIGSNNSVGFWYGRIVNPNRLKG